jgi:hypothetical protein
VIRLRSLVAVLSLASLCAGASPAIAGDEAAKAPEQILADAVTALGEVPALRVAGTQTDRIGLDQVSLIVTASGRAQIEDRWRRHGTLRSIIIGHTLYLRGTKGYWKALGLSRSNVQWASTHWIKLALIDARGTESSTVTPSSFARGLQAGHGTLANAGPAVVDGQPAVVVQDAGDLPGSAPGQITIADATPAYPLRLTATGRRRPGGPTGGPCDHTYDTNTAVDLRITPLTAAPAIAAPKGAKTVGPLTWK